MNALPETRPHTTPLGRAIVLELAPLGAAVAALAVLPFGLLILLVAPVLAVAFAVSGLGWFSVGRPFEGTCVLLVRGAAVVAAYAAYWSWLSEPADCGASCSRLADLAAPLLLLACVLPVVSALVLALSERAGRE